MEGTIHTLNCTVCKYSIANRTIFKKRKTAKRQKQHACFLCTDLSDRLAMLSVYINKLEF